MLKVNSLSQSFACSSCCAARHFCSMWAALRCTMPKLPESLQGCITINTLQLAAFSSGAQEGAACCAEAEQLP